MYPLGAEGSRVQGLTGEGGAKTLPASSIRRAGPLHGPHNDAVVPPLPDKEPNVISARKLCLLSVPAIAAVSLTVGTGVAVADDDGYLAQIKKIGLTGDSTALIQLGHLICADRANGDTPDQLAQVVQKQNPGISLSDATGVVSAAESNYCP
ncbi:DUF732 domain-containing protein [Mycobacterium montefiorense]|nr:DUF732 domain-containing protein [Mycobacterium montefiorense]